MIKDTILRGIIRSIDREIVYLLRKKNFRSFSNSNEERRNGFFDQFTGRIQRLHARKGKLRKLNPINENSKKPSTEKNIVIKFEKVPVVTANCVVCRHSYQSSNPKEELGKCDTCTARELRRILDIPPPIGNQSPNKAVNHRRKAEPIFPYFLGKELIFKIQEFFFENYITRRRFGKKTAGIIPIKEAFGVELSEKQLQSLTTKQQLAKAGFNY